jgi:16S rRNA (guanine527-N7)-methyltransferase
LTIAEQTLQRGLKPLGLVLTEDQLSAFQIYGQELITWNQRFNLTRISRPEDIAIKHFLDSLSIYPVLAELSPTASMIDVGAGPGFPGLPLKIVLADFQLTLLEATAKKIGFLQHVVDLLHLTATTVVKARAEEAGQQPAQREQYDVAVARAVAALPTLAEYTLPLVRVGGLVVAQKGRHPADEVDRAAKALRVLGAGPVEIRPVKITGLAEARHLVVIRKIAPTPQEYPRRAGVPARKPL